MVPKPLRGLMGEAHLCFARGAHEEAVAMCSEIIKQAPKCPDPFQLLGMIYEDKGEMEKSLQVRYVYIVRQSRKPQSVLFHSSC